MKKIILLGIKNNQIITAGLEISNRNGFPQFSASFQNGEAFNIEEIDENYKENYYNDLWDCYDEKGKLDLLFDGERTKEDVFEEWGQYDDYREIKDCSCTDYETENNGKTINFESCRGGQYDVREDDDFEDMKFTNEKLFNDIMYYWDKFHLKKVNDKEIEEINKLMQNEFIENSNEFNNFIINNIDWAVL